MATSVVSFITFSLLFIIFSVIADGKSFAAAYREHRKLSGGKETTTMMRRNLEGNENDGSKTAVHGSVSNPRHNGQKNTQHEPNQEPTEEQQQHVSYGAIKSSQGCAATRGASYSTSCIGHENENRRGHYRTRYNDTRS